MPLIDIPRRSFLTTSTLGAAAMFLRPFLHAAEPARYAFDPLPDIILAPEDPALWPQYRADLAAWRERRRVELKYSDALYRRPDFKWVASSYACYFLMLNDERFYDAAADHYRVSEWLEMVGKDLGGCDSVVLWHAYPRIGLDDRNQFDFYRDQPGGLPALRRVVDELHRAGVRSYIDYNPWDTGTRREAKSDLDMLCEIVGALDVDGIFLDTMKEGAEDFRNKLDAVKPGVALEGEIALPMERITDHHLAWAQGFKDSEAPGVVRNKWFERGHQLHHVHRFGRDRTAYFQTAFMNGSGTMLWDNVFGTWVGYSEREKSILRSMLPIQRRFTTLFSGEGWTPLVPTAAKDIYASLWEAPNIRLWTLVNRATGEVKVTLPDLKLEPGERLWDLISGSEVKSPEATLRRRGIGCFVAARRDALGGDFDAFLEKQRLTDQAANWDWAFPAHVQTRLKASPATPKHNRTSVPEGMVLLAGADWRMKIQFRNRECGLYDSTTEKIKNWGKLHDLGEIERDVTLAPFAMDLTPVTNARFAEFLTASKYQPRHREKFLQHWKNGSPPAGLEEHPVIYVHLDDARAFAKWAGKRLPTEDEWQFAAQGIDGRLYPWGNEAPDDTRCNADDKNNGTTPVKRYPNGRSAEGIYDLCGNTWEWTESERADGVNRFSMIRGGSYYKAVGTHWYMDGGPAKSGFAAKFMHTWPGLDRCGTIGFRCVVDVS